MKIGQLLLMAREISGRTIRDLERETGISNALISQMETGQVKSPSFRNVVKIARGLPTTFALDHFQLIFRTPSAPPSPRPRGRHDARTKSHQGTARRRNSGG